MNQQNQSTQNGQESHLRSVKSSEASVPTLIRQLADDATNLVSKEIRLAKTEMFENINNLKKGAVSVASSSFVLNAGLLTLVFSAVTGLATVMELWLSALIIGSAITLIGFAMLGAGKKKMDAAAMRPDHTIDSVKDDKRAARGAL